MQQVILRGRTVLEAWTTTPTTRQLSMMKKDQDRLHHDPENLNPAWTPRQAGSSPVYHGSIVSNPHWALQFTNNPFDALDARISPNQMVTDAFGVIFTTFSPLRAFLWAAFHSVMPRVTSDAADILQTQNTWISGGKSYRGVVLFKFNSIQPAPVELTSYVIPEGKEAEWGNRSLLSVGISINKQRAWGHYRDIHGQSGDNFPDVVHGLEYGQQLTGLTPFHTNMWRTIWRDGTASSHLTSQHAATYAISFERGRSVVPLLPGIKSARRPDESKDTERDEDNGPKGKLRRRLKDRATMVFKYFSEGDSMSN